MLPTQTGKNKTWPLIYFVWNNPATSTTMPTERIVPVIRETMWDIDWLGETCPNAEGQLHSREQWLSISILLMRLLCPDDHELSGCSTKAQVKHWFTKQLNFYNVFSLLHNSSIELVSFHISAASNWWKDCDALMKRKNKRHKLAKPSQKKQCITIQPA